jgi:hypothetical protein
VWYWLGLALAEKISHLMKAVITINSKKEGAEFIFQCTLEVSQDDDVPASQQWLMT